MIKKARNINLVLEIKVNSTPLPRLLSILEKKIKLGKKTFVVTLNPEMVVLACKQPDFKAIINSADVIIPDGSGIVWALKRQARLASNSSRESRRGNKEVKRLTGIDLMLELIKTGHKTLLVGAKPGIAQAAAQKLGVYGISEPDVKEINKVKPDLLFVALGHGKQERWISKNLPKLNVKLAMGIGGALDQIAKPWLRAPQFMRQVGLEWLWRLLMQPWRIKRQLTLIEFAWKVLK
jgi:N-acetylglucosaminyldiphosphoundecaprenol N-acetyl-beta-D-mannosaminyltransferase